VASIPVDKGGFFDVVLDWEGEELAHNRFAIGVRGQAE
jgi:hypothetical protein